MSSARGDQPSATPESEAAGARPSGTVRGGASEHAQGEWGAARALANEVERRRRAERALREALQERTRIERDLRASLERESQARARAEASDAFKQVFLDMLGHDLRNPLSTILTTARIMTMRERAPEDDKKLRRIISSGERMRRMIDQILDVTRARLTTGIAVARGEPQDVQPLVARIVAEQRAAHPERVIELDAPAAAPARVDADRLAQVVNTLIGNALAHGDPARPIRVALATCAQPVVLSVQNYGQPIAKDAFPSLFDPFRRGGRPQGRSAALGMGLYVSHCIVAAHGGTIEVDSSLENGTRFEVTLPGP